MIRNCMAAGLLAAVVATPGGAQDKPKLPDGTPPRLVSVVEVKGDVVVYRDFYFAPPIPQRTGQINAKELVPSHPAGGPLFGCAVEFPLREGEVYDTEGNRVAAEAVRGRLAVGDTVLVSTSGKAVAPEYLRAFRKGTLVFVHPKPKPGPPLPKPGPPLPGAQPPPGNPGR
jgi:hypothetical protein